MKMITGVKLINKELDKPSPRQLFTREGQLIIETPPAAKIYITLEVTMILPAEATDDEIKQAMVSLIDRK